MYIEKLASQIRNDVVSGLRGYHTNLSMNLEQLQDEIVACRLNVIEQYFRKGIYPKKDLLMAINCIDTDCKSLERCNCGVDFENSDKITHFQLPQIVSQYGKDAIDYIGSIDRKNKFTIITSLSELNIKKYRKRGTNKPYVWIDYAPNSDGMLDCYILNAPFLKQISVVAVFKDPRQLHRYSCCQTDELMGFDTNMSFIDQQIKDQLTEQKINYYRRLAANKLPNDQQYVTGG